MYSGIKRILDFLIALAACILLLPLFLLLAAAVKLSSPGPVFFVQKRFGRHKRFFMLYKFRSMAANAPHDIPTNDFEGSDAYITPFGRFLRHTSLDELPQLFNILRGDMALVGPRPALWNQTNLIRERDGYPCRFGGTVNDLRPGMTGLAQISGRDLLDDAAKAYYDGEYAKKVSFLFDCRCTFRTAFAVVSARGVREGASSK